MNIAANKKAVRRLLEDVITKNKSEYLDELCTENIEVHWRNGKSSIGIAQVKEFLRIHSDSFPDFVMEITDIVAEKDRVAVRVVQHGTHKGEWEGVSPTGKKWRVWEHIFFRLRDGRIAEMWPLVDIDGRKEQLGFSSVPPGV